MTHATGKGQRHAIFARWVADELLPPAAAAAAHSGASDRARPMVLDVAGGKGHLAHELRVRGLSPVLVDPCALCGRSSITDSGHFAGAASVLATRAKAEPASAPESTVSAAVRCMTLQQLATAEPQLIARCAALVGLHPDEATEHLVDIALAGGKAFAVLPCCVMPHLFPVRRLKSSGARVVSPLPRTRLRSPLAASATDDDSASNFDG